MHLQPLRCSKVQGAVAESGHGSVGWVYEQGLGKQRQKHGIQSLLSFCEQITSAQRRALGPSQRPKYFPSLPLPKMSLSFVLLYVFLSNLNAD